MKPLTETEYIHALIAEGEHQQQDFKFEIFDARKIAKTLSAFANTKGGRYLAYIRIEDENILATPVHLRVWQQSVSPQGELIEYTEREQLLLDLLEENDQLSLNRYCRLAHLSRRSAEHLLAKFVRYDIVEPVFEEHKFHFKLKGRGFVNKEY